MILPDPFPPRVRTEQDALLVLEGVEKGSEYAHLLVYFGDPEYDSCDYEVKIIPVL